MEALALLIPLVMLIGGWYGYKTAHVLESIPWKILGILLGAIVGLFSLAAIAILCGIFYVSIAYALGFAGFAVC